MSTTVQPLVQEPTVWETISTKAQESAQWLGKTVKYIGAVIAEYAVKVWEYVKPFFEAAGRFIAENWEKAKEFVREHKEYTAAAVAGTAVVALVSLVFYYMCCGSNQATPPAGTTTTAATTTTTPTAATTTTTTTTVNPPATS